jgi:hypothetical protein
LLYVPKAKPDSAHHQTALATSFKQPPRQSRAFIYDLKAEFPEYASLIEMVQDRLGWPLEKAFAKDQYYECLPTQVRFFYKFSLAKLDSYFFPVQWLDILYSRRPLCWISSVRICTMDHRRLAQNLSLSRTMSWKASRRYPRITIYTYPIQKVNLSYSSRNGKILKVIPAVKIALNGILADVRSGVIEIIRQSKSTPAQK